MAFSGRIFQWVLLSATVLPFLLGLGHVHAFLGLLAVMGLVASTHVFSTSYLFLQRGNLAGIENVGLKVFWAPLVLMAFIYAMLLLAPLGLVLALMLVYIHFALWHFGRQNLGVMAFAARISRGRPISRFERVTIMAAVIAGVCGAYHALSPALGLNPKLFPFDLRRVTPVLSWTWYAGAAIYAILVPVVAVGCWQRRRDYDLPSLLTYLASVLFFLPMYVAANSVLAMQSWAIAHGLQYLVFLGYHASGRTRWALLGLLPLALFAGCAGAGYVVWNEAAVVQSWSSPLLAKGAVATLTAITLAHYWVDMFVWRFRSSERRRWLAASYPFLAAAAPAVVPASAVTVSG